MGRLTVAQAERDFPNLLQVLGGYLHQDWDLDAETPDDALRAAALGQGPDQLAAAIRELERLLEGDLDDRELHELIERLTSGYAPRVDGWNAREWLAHVRELLRPGLSPGTHLARAIPALPVRDVAAAAAFYRDRLAFETVLEKDGFASVRRDGAEIHLWCAGDESWGDRDEWTQPVQSGAESFIAGTASCRIDTWGIALLFEEYRARGVLHPASTELTEQPWGALEFAALDLDGNLLMFVQWKDPR